MNPFKWFSARRKERREDREAIERAEREQMRAGEHRPPSQAEVFEEAESRFSQD